MTTTNNKPLFQYSTHGITNEGIIRSHNEDALFMNSDNGLWVVADGMGGHDAGELASQMIIEHMEKVGFDQSLEQLIDNIEDSLIDVNKYLYKKAKSAAVQTTIGSTVVILLIYNNYCVYMWVGDSRLYRLRDEQLRQMTTDHSQVQSYIEQGLISREEAIVHPHSHMINRAVGVSKNLYVDIDIQTIQPNDRYLLCSDGLTKHIVDIEFQDILQNGDSESVCKELIDLTLYRGAGDNVTSIVIDILSN